MMAQLIDRKHLKQEMKELLRSAQVSPRGMTCLYLALVLVLNLADSFMGLMNPGLLGTFISILTGLMSMVLASGFVMYCMAIRRGERAEYLTLFDGFSFVGKVILLNIVIYLFTFFWSLLFVIPGIIAAYRYRFAFLILFDNETMTAREALNASKRMTVGYKSDLFRLDLSFIWYYVLLALPSIASSLALQGYFTIPDRLAVPIYLAETLYLSVIQILFMPYVATATAHLYNQVLAEQQGPAPEQDPRLSGEF